MPATHQPTYTLITGATGLLGGFLLRNALRRDWPVAVVVRRSTTRTAAQRIDTVLAPWERDSNLPRPVILTGDVSQPGLGLPPAERQWIAANVQRVIHSAASISFYRDENSNEPYRSNVEGTRHVLALCRELGIREYHHISTAYVCGRREGKVLETELDVGQQPGNDYEKSKVAAEQLVAAADWLERPTIYRPSIIIGDSQSGYTTTFHGYYTPLQVAWWLAQANVLSTGVDDWFLNQLGLRGAERKNVVPVDWVAEATLRIVEQAEQQGRTYHLTNPHPPTVLELSQAIGEVIRPQLAQAAGKSSAIPADLMEQDFRRHMDVYRAYFRDDPQFDQTHYQRAVPNWPCPVVDRAMLIRTGQFALQTNFGWPRPALPQPPVDWPRWWSSLPPGSPEEGSVYTLEITGCGGGAVSLVVTPTGPKFVQLGRAPRADGYFRLRGDVFAAILQNLVTLEKAAQSGYAYIAAPPEHVRALKQLVAELIEHQIRAAQKT